MGSWQVIKRVRKKMSMANVPKRSAVFNCFTFSPFSHFLDSN
jgi:hypothetical protein